MVQELLATANVVFLAYVAAVAGVKQCMWVPDYSAETDRLAEAIRVSEEESQKRGECVVYVAAIKQEE